MADLHSFTDRFFYQNRREYTVHDGNIAYLDGKPLTRSLTMPKVQRIILVAIVALALIIGAVFVNNTIVANIRATSSQQEAIAANLARTASIDALPSMAQLINMDDDTIRASLEGAGLKIYDASAMSESGETLLYKVPDDMTVEEAGAMFLKGIGTLDAVSATKLLNGSWFLTIDRVNTTSMIVRYVDFATANPETAVKNAIRKEGFDTASVTESGEDDSGNTFSTGTLDADGTPCVWKVSAIPLEEIYSIKGMPEGGCYVGIRVTAQG